MKSGEHAIFLYYSKYIRVGGKLVVGRVYVHHLRNSIVLGYELQSEKKWVDAKYRL